MREKESEFAKARNELASKSREQKEALARQSKDHQAALAALQVRNYSLISWLHFVLKAVTPRPRIYFSRDCV